MPPEFSNGYWHDPAMDDQAGTFAVIIGVSQYDYLPANDDVDGLKTSYGLGQLHVSASTAYAFFDWLRGSYQFGRAPLCKCWVLLAPTAAESAINGELAKTVRPTLQACEDALGEAVAAIEALDPSYIADSRFVFFFSGHGIERYPNQLLCPSDYLRKPGLNPNKALSIVNLRGGLRRYSLRDDFFFIDACRSNPGEMANIKLDGESTLVEMPSFQASANRNSPILWGTKSGAETWQPATPKAGVEGLSIFGRALIEALNGQAKTDEDCGHDAPGHITIDRVHSYARRRVQALLESHGQTALDPVRKGGDYGEGCITEPRSRAPALVEGVERGFPGPMSAGERETTLLTVTRNGVNLGIPVEGEAQSVGPPQPDSPVAIATARVPLPDGGVRGDVGIAALHQIFQSEYLSALWHSARAVPLLQLQTTSSIRIEAFEWVGQEAGRVTISVSGEGAHWLQLDDRFGTRFAAVLPGDRGSPTPLYVIEFARQQGQSLRQFSVNLAFDNPDTLGRMARVWQEYQDFGARQAVSQLDASESERAVQDKMNGPLAATIGALLLLRARRFDELRDWTGNLASKFPDRTDGAVLRAEQLRQMRSETMYPEELLQRLDAVAKGPLPQLAETFGYAIDQTREILRFVANAPTAFGNPSISVEVLRNLQALQTRFEMAARYFQSGGLCSTFVGPTAEIQPGIVMANGSVLNG